MGIAVGSYFVLSDDPQKAKWLNEEEKGESPRAESESRIAVGPLKRMLTLPISTTALAAARVKMDNVGMPKVIDSLSTKAMLDGIRNPTTLIASLIFLLDNITVQGLGFFCKPEHLEGQSTG